MPCLTINPGLFRTDVNWNGTNSSATTPNGTTVNKTATAISIARAGHTTYSIPKPATSNLAYMTFVDHIWILYNETNAGPVTRTVTLIKDNGTTFSEVSILMVLATSNAVDIPVIQPSQMSGDVFLIYGANGTGATADLVGTSIRNSFTGDSICAGPPPFHPTGQTIGEATATQLIIHFVTTTGSQTISCPLPSGECNVIPDTQTFPVIVVGPGVPPALSTSQRTFVVRNDGDNCLRITSIANSTHFSIGSVTPALPFSLDPGAQLSVVVNFTSATIGSFTENLVINPAPSAGDLFIRCTGTARAPIVSIQITPSPVSFGLVPLGSTANRNLVIKNSGEVALNVSVAAAISGSPFQWGALNATLNPGDQVVLPLNFTPVSETEVTANLIVNSNAPGSPHTILVRGTGCVANAEIVTPPSPFPSFGAVQQGFRTVRLIRIRNTGDGPLNFRARISGVDAALFGLQQEGGSITSPLPEIQFSVAPIVACGALTTGSGEQIVAITFYADSGPRTANAQLIIDNHNDMRSGVPTSFSFNLVADIIAAIAVDAALVMDRSFSMNETSGSRNKSQTSIDAGKLFIQLARPNTGDRMAIVRFNNVPEILTHFTDITTASQVNLANTVNPTNFSPAGSTSIAGGVRVGLRDFTDTPRAIIPPEYNKAIVVMTDGKDNTPFTDPVDGITYSLLGENGTTALPTPGGIKVYAVGIGDSIDNGRLGQLAQATGGDFMHVLNFSGQTYFGLEKYFTQIYMNLVDLATISDPVYTILPMETHDIDFSVLRGDVSFMVVLYDKDGIRIPFYLKSPKGEIIDPFSLPAGFQVRPGITNTARFLEVRFPMGEPDRYAGLWKVVVYHDGKACYYKDDQRDALLKRGNEFSFGFKPSECKPWQDPIIYGIAIGVGSNFRMIPYVEPGIKTVGEPILVSAGISEFGLPVTGCIVEVEATNPNGVVTHLRLNDDGLHSDGDGNDGMYAKAFLQTYVEGFYTFLFRSTGLSRDGETVQREGTLSKYVQGRTPLVPEGVPGGSKEGDDCCKRTIRVLVIGFVLIILLLLVIIFLLRQP